VEKGGCALKPKYGPSVWMNYLVLALGSIIMILPFLWMVSTSLKANSEVFVFPPEWIPQPVMWSNYVNVWNAAPFDLFFLNTIKITVILCAGRLLISSMAAFAFSRLRFPGRNALFLVYLATMMVPYQVTLIPTFIIMRELNWMDTHLALIVPGLFSAFGVFLLRQFFQGIPKELEEAARIDGASYIGIYWRLILPLAVPAMTALAIFTFLGSWNDFMAPLVYLNTLDKFTLALGLASLQGMHETDWPLLMTGAVLSLLPILIVFFFAQKRFIEGITLQGSMKG
jgi:multiple sugar transport system permease protein